MKLRAERAEFAEAVSWATRTVGARVTLPALSGVLLEAADGRLTCRATDLEVAAEISIPVQIDQPGRVLLPGRLLSQLVARFPDAPVQVTGEPDRVEITCGRATFRVRGMQAEDFPTLAQPAEDAPQGVVKADAFARLVSQVARAASSDEGRPVLTGVHLQAAGDTLTAAATDSYRLAVRSLAWEEAVEGTALVPARSLQEAAKAASEVGGAVTIVMETGQVSFLFGDRRLTTKLIEGTFPNYRALLPDAHETSVVVQRATLVEALQRVSIVAMGQANTPVSLTFGDGSVDLQASNQEMGDAAEALPAEIDGDGLTIAFNPGFLLAGLEATGTERIRVELRDGLKPAVLRPHADDGQVDDLTYLLMPMRVS
ncbi:DNA polymerase III subunit beta [Egicoccus halophilus]|uniref:Beta sliding clamp n=1 Tax=Egicoccus halophilus TaxID=1670830 RepID=A0A8J3A5J7_9ACTN|nr:DNA polymerase III subunit beta [Egicoccus halophilus]GGI03105.1 DNA polymerase III subunit beta [Egicoccus halophilus]